MPFRKFDDSMRAMAEALSQPGYLDQALDRIVHAAATPVPGADYASITVKHADGQLTTTAASAAIVRKADELQYELREGPCYDAVTVETLTYSPDLSLDPQWPRFGIIMERYDLNSERAFEFLIRLSQNSNVKLRDIAADVINARSRAEK